MIEIRPLYPRTWEPSEPLVAYNNADSTVVAAAEMSRGNNSYYDRYGYQGSQDIVCADCKQDGRDVPVILVDAERTPALPPQTGRSARRPGPARGDS